MVQVIQVDIVHPDTKERLGTKMTLATTHEEAIALWFGCPTECVFLDKHPPVVNGEHILSPNCWKYAYLGVITDPEVGNRDFFAVLFATYPERKKKENE